jgi:hypothetical protein
MIDLLRALSPITASELIAHVARLKRTDPVSSADLPEPNEVPSHLRAFEKAVPPLAVLLPTGEWDAVPVVVAPAKPKDVQKGFAFE